MSCSARPVLLVALYCLNFGVITCLLAAAFFLSQGLFGDLYTCNEKTLGEIEQVYDRLENSQWPQQLCLVDLNYTAPTVKDVEQQSYYALQIMLPCNRITEDGNRTSTALCYNRYHPEYFSSINIGDDLESSYSEEDADRDLQFGYRAALWMALLGFLASGLHRHMDFLDRSLLQMQEFGLQLIKQTRARCGLWRFERRFRCTFGWRRREEEEDRRRARDSEMQNMAAREEV